MDVSILYEDDDVLVINKPAGLIVHSDGRTREPSVSDWVMEHYPDMKDVGEPWVSPQGETISRPGIVHRLDRTTSGVMILAKHQVAHAFLKKQFQTRSAKKTYLAYVYGHPKDNEGVVEAEIRRTRTTPPRWTAEPGGKTRRTAVTRWKLLKRGKDAHTHEPVSLFELSPVTGRTHQIRVHLKFLHHPVVADPLYASGNTPLLGFTRPALHAYRLALTLPNGKERVFEASLPADFKEAEVALV